jgi:hypothetical protein
MKHLFALAKLRRIRCREQQQFNNLSMANILMSSVATLPSPLPEPNAFMMTDALSQTAATPCTRAVHAGLGRCGSLSRLPPEPV